MEEENQQAQGQATPENTESAQAQPATENQAAQQPAEQPVANATPVNEVAPVQTEAPAQAQAPVTEETPTLPKQPMGQAPTSEENLAQEAVSAGQQEEKGQQTAETPAQPTKQKTEETA